MSPTYQVINIDFPCKMLSSADILPWLSVDRNFYGHVGFVEFGRQNVSMETATASCQASLDNHLMFCLRISAPAYYIGLFCKLMKIKRQCNENADLATRDIMQ